MNHVAIFPNGFGPVKLLIANKQLMQPLHAVHCSCSTAFPTRKKPGQARFLSHRNDDSAAADFGGLKLAVVRKIATGRAWKRRETRSLCLVETQWKVMSSAAIREKA